MCAQVPRILNPVVMVLDELPKLVRDPEIRTYLDSAFGGVDRCRKLILTDFCRHAFDGSGACCGCVRGCVRVFGARGARPPPSSSCCARRVGRSVRRRRQLL